MNVAIFGGTFDPVHRGHLAVARAAQVAYDLGRIYFVPADIPPHKQRQPITPFYHRYAMLALALREERAMIPSLMEAPSEEARRTPNFSIDTVRRFRSQMSKTDRLFFMVGVDAFMAIATWRKPEELLREVEFIVANRPGYSMVDIANALPESMRKTPGLLALAKSIAGKKLVNAVGTTTLALPGVTLHLLSDVSDRASSTRFRVSAAAGRFTKGLLDDAVVEYIRKEHLYKGLQGNAERSRRRRQVVSARGPK